MTTQPAQILEALEHIDLGVMAVLFVVVLNMTLAIFSFFRGK